MAGRALAETLAFELKRISQAQTRFKNLLTNVMDDKPGLGPHGLPAGASAQHCFSEVLLVVLDACRLSGWSKYGAGRGDHRKMWGSIPHHSTTV
jgi:hypothetical protein